MAHFSNKILSRADNLRKSQGRDKVIIGGQISDICVPNMRLLGTQTLIWPPMMTFKCPLKLADTMPRMILIGNGNQLSRRR